MKNLLLGVVFLALASAPAFADVQLTMQNGRVTIVAKDATVRQILNEWSKVGKTNIVNVERVPGGPITLELRNVTEGQALEVLLRSLSGYITAPRAEQAANLSQFDRIIIMPTVASARPTPAGAPPAVFQTQQQAPTYQQPQVPQMATPPPADDDADEERPAPNVQIPNIPPQPGRSPAFNAVPMQAPTTAPQGTYPGMPVGGLPNGAGNTPVPQQPVSPVNPFGGVAVPGMIVAPPPQPGQVQPGVQQPLPQQPGQPVRRPGGVN
jgi:hypothetical protein